MNSLLVDSIQSSQNPWNRFPPFGWIRKFWLVIIKPPVPHTDLTCEGDRSAPPPPPKKWKLGINFLGDIASAFGPCPNPKNGSNGGQKLLI